MNPALLACLLLSLLIIIGRGPLIFAPEATLKFAIEQIFAFPWRTRALGLLMIGLAALLVMTMKDLVAQTFPEIMFIVGLVIAAGAMLLVAAPGFTRELVTTVSAALEPAVLRVIGVLSVAIALLIAYFALVTF